MPIARPIPVPMPIHMPNKVQPRLMHLLLQLAMPKRTNKKLVPTSCLVLRASCCLPPALCLPRPLPRPLPPASANRKVSTRSIVLGVSGFRKKRRCESSQKDNVSARTGAGGQEHWQGQGHRERHLGWAGLLCPSSAAQRLIVKLQCNVDGSNHLTNGNVRCRVCPLACDEDDDDAVV